MTESDKKVTLELDNARVLVAGGASHLGRAISLAFASQGSTVVIADIDEIQAFNTADCARELGGCADVRAADLTVERDAIAAAAWMAEKYGGIDILVNNVGWHIPTWFSDISDETVLRTLNLNLVTTINSIRAVLPYMISQERGSVVSIASDAAFGEVKSSIYGAAKAGVISLTKALAKEHGKYGVRFNAVAPGLLESPQPEAVGGSSVWSENNGGVTVKQSQAILQSIPLGRLTTSTDVAPAVLYFASERMSGQVTGQVISVSGGYAMP